jgi:hypothetical protein
MNARELSGLLGLLLLCAPACGARADGVDLGGNLVARFASVAEGQTILTNRDDFTAALSPEERAARMFTNPPVAEPEFLAYAGGNVLSWTAAETNRLGGMLQAVGRKLAPWHLPFPGAIWIIKTTGREEIPSFYTRQNAVIIPRQDMGEAGPDVLTHELFHILSRQNPELRRKLYGIIGFTRINEVTPPEEWRSRHFTNPDGNQNGWLITLTNQNQVIQAVPELYSPVEFDPAKTVNPFGFFRLLVVTNSGERWSPKLAGGHAQLLHEREVQGFYEQIGRNTRYVIHPDEILAENFVLLINGDTNAETPRILQEMKRVLLENALK